jgi:hypothetical protein
VPEEFDTGGGTGVSGLRRAFGVVTKLAKQPELEDTLDKLFNEALQKGAMRLGGITISQLRSYSELS